LTPIAKREHHVMVVLSDAEVALLDEHHRGSAPRATYLRRLFHGPSKEEDVASRAEAMAILTRLARDGKQQAAVSPRSRVTGGGEVDPRLLRWMKAIAGYWADESRSETRGRHSPGYL
jgi:hypothetical protein